MSTLHTVIQTPSFLASAKEAGISEESATV